MSMLPYKTLLLLVFITLSDNVLNAQIPEFALNGSAIQTDDFCYELTQAVNTQFGSIWNFEQLNLNNDFTLNFLLNFGTQDEFGADGIYFALQPISTSLGGSGGGIGFDGIATSLGVEFDTWQNTDSADPFDDHLAVQMNGDVNHSGANNLEGPVNISATNTNVEDGNDHLVYIVWTASNQTMRIFFDCEIRLNYTGDIVNDIFGGDPNVYWGFTSATGGYNNLHKVCLLDADFFDLVSDTTICQGDAVELIAPIGESYVWSPEEGLDDPSSQTPIANPDTTTIYTVTVFDQCGTPNDHQLTVTVDPCIDCSANTEIVSLDSELIIFCPDSSVQLLATGASFYEWEANPTLSATDIPNPIATPDSSTWYYVTGYSAENCPTIDSIFLFASIPPNVPPVWETDVCNGIAQTIIIGDLADVSSWSYNWSPEDGLDNPNIYNPTATVSETTTYTATVTNSDGCPVTQIATINFTTEIDSIDFGTEELCVGGNTLLEINSLDFDEYEWEDNSTQSSLFVDTAGTYSVSLLNTTTGCQGFGQFEVTVEDQQVGIFPYIQTFCENDSLSISPPGSFQTYEWDNGSNETAIYVSNSGQSTVTLTDDQGCKSDFIISYETNPLPQPIIVGDTFFFVGQTSLLSTNQNYTSYEWSTGSTASQISVAEAGIYSVEVTDDQNCKGENSIEIFTEIPTTLLVPQAFTPNNDGINDLFRLISSETLNDFSIQIYNRWGLLLYEANHNDGWDGTYKNNNLPLGVYLYYMEATKNDGSVEEFKGNVSLIR